MKFFGLLPKGGNFHIRDRSCRLRCSLRLKALLQNWHLYLRSGARVALREDGVEAAGGGRTATLAPGILVAESRVWFVKWLVMAMGVCRR